MKAIVYDRYGPPEVLRLEDVDRPVPRDDEVLIRIAATAVNMGDCELRRPDIPNSIWFLIRLFFGLTRPRKRILGAYFAGEVEAVGRKVERFAVGDAVMAGTGARFGAYAEFICLPADGSIGAKPANLSYEEAAAAPLGGTNALHYLRVAELKAGERILVNGAGGSFGTFAVQLAKSMGAHVTGVDHGDKHDLIRELGADQVLDYTREDFTESGETWDVIFNVIADIPLRRHLRCLRPGGRYILSNPGGILQMLHGAWVTRTSDKTVILQFAKETADDLDRLRELVEAGKLRPVIDRIFPMTEVVEAHRYVETGRKRGDVILRIPD